MPVTRRTFLLTCAAACPSVLLPAYAQTFPTRPLRWIVGYSAGSGLDFVARVVSDAMGKELGQEVIVENKPGAAGSISADALLSAPSDGYTLLSADVGIYALNPHLYKKLRYQSPRDFRVVGMMVDIPMVLFVPSSLGASTVDEFVAHVRSRPSRTVNFASSGIGNPTHLTMELFMRASGLDMVHVPYKGSPDAFTNLITGETSAFFVGPNDGMPHVKAGRLKVLATATDQRLATLPDVPTLKEAGYDAAFQVWLSMVVAADTPAGVIERLNRGLNAAMTRPEVVSKLQAAGFQIPERTTSAEADAFAKADYERWGKFLPPLDIRLD